MAHPIEDRRERLEAERSAQAAAQGQEGLPFKGPIVPGHPEYRETVYKSDGAGGLVGIMPTIDQKPVDPNDYVRKLMDAAKASAVPQKLIDQAVVNPKELAGAKKPATWSVLPRWIVLQVGRVMSVGAAKYGAFNYRESPIAASTYQDALERHLALWFDGEDNDSETGVSHLASAIASCALLMDAQATGKLVDDRQKTGLVRKHLDELEALLVSLPLPARKIH